MITKTFDILIVDDEPRIRFTMRTALEAEGYHIEEATNGREALDAIAERRPDLVLLDLSMPVMDGMRFLAELRDLPADQRPPVVVLTAYGSINAAVRTLKLGARDFVEKPVTPNELRAAVEMALVEPGPEAALRQSSNADAEEASYKDVLSLIREGLRCGNLNSAESMLMRAGTIAPDDDAAFLNLAGVFHEASGRKESARRFYGRAIRVNRNYRPAQQNMRRLFELERFGRTREPIALGDELQFLSNPPTPAERESLFQRLARLLSGT